MSSLYTPLNPSDVDASASKLEVHCRAGKMTGVGIRAGCISNDVCTVLAGCSMSETNCGTGDCSDGGPVPVILSGSMIVPGSESGSAMLAGCTKEACKRYKLGCQRL